MKVVIGLLLILLATSASAQFGDPYPADWFGFVRDLDSTDQEPPCYWIFAPFTEVTLHLAIANPSAGAVSSWHTGAIVVPEFPGLSITYTAGSDLTPDMQTDVFIGMGELALTPNATGLVHLADIRFFNMTMDQIDLQVLPHDGEPGGHYYMGPDDGVTPIPLTLAFDFYDYAPYWINADCSVGIDDELTTWGNVKAVYR